MSSARAEKLMFAVSKSSEVSRILPYMVTRLSVQYPYDGCNSTCFENATNWIELRNHSGLYGIIGTTAIQGEANNHSQAIDPTGSLSVRSLHPLRSGRIRVRRPPWMMAQWKQGGSYPATLFRQQVVRRASVPL